MHQNAVDYDGGDHGGDDWVCIEESAVQGCFIIKNIKGMMMKTTTTMMMMMAITIMTTNKMMMTITIMTTNKMMMIQVGPADGYVLTVGGFNDALSTLGDSMALHNGYKFTTK